MGESCHYHPTKKAHWVCPSCEVTYCPDCVDNRVVEQYGKKKVYHFCPECNVEAERVPFEDTVVPFWYRFPKFFVYPFHNDLILNRLNAENNREASDFQFLFLYPASFDFTGYCQNLP